MQRIAPLILIAAVAGGASAQSRQPDASVLERLAAEAAAACPVPGSGPPAPGIGLVMHGQWLAGLHQRVGLTCTPRPDLALRIARAEADRPSITSASAYQLLAELYRRGLGVAADPGAAGEQLRRAWLVGGPAVVEDPFATPAERDAYLARPATVALLRRYAAHPDLPVARVRLARALLTQRSAAARVEALALLDVLGTRDLAEARFLRARTALDYPLTRAAAIAELRRLSLAGQDPEARNLLASIVRRELAVAGTEQKRWEAIESLAVLAGSAPEAAAELRRAVMTANGGRAPATLTGPALAAVQPRLRAPMTNDDYPSGALRGEEVGRIALRGLVDPRGRLIFTEPLGPGQPAMLLRTVQRIYAARPLSPVELGAARATPYMWVELPGVVFEIRE